MKILVVSPYVPYEGVPHAGGYFLLRHLELLASSGHEITLLGAALPEEDVARAPSWLVVSAAPILPEQRVGRLTRLVRRTRRASRWASLSDDSALALRRAGLDRMAREADVVELHFPEIVTLARHLRKLGGVRVASHLHDVASDLFSRRLRDRSRRDRIRAALATPLRRWNERRDLDAADVLFVFKAGDITALRRRGVRTSILLAEPALDPPSQRSSRSRLQVLFTGAMWREENADAARWLLDRVWPAVVDAVPGAQLVVAGADPPPDVVLLAGSRPGARVTGYVPDLDPYYVQSSVYVAPVFAGAGLKFKVPQAMLYGLPVVATTHAAEGIVDEAPEGTFWAVTDEGDAMAAAIVEALRDPIRAAEVGDAAADWCSTRFSFAGHAARVITCYEALASTPG